MQTSRWPISKLPIAHLEPFPYHKGELYVELLDRLAKYVTQQLHPNLRETVEHVVEEMEHVIADTHAKYVDGIQDFQRIHDAFMTDVNSALMALNDQAVTDLVQDPGSALGGVLAETYERRSRNNTQNYQGSAHQRLESALADDGAVQFDETLTHTGNIAGFWNTVIYGTGTIELPDGEVFTPDPHPTSHADIVNTLYVNESQGHDTNDGLTPHTAFQTLQGMYRTTLRRLTSQQAAGAKWVVRLTGTITEGLTANYLPRFPHGLLFQGDTTTVLEKTPTTTRRVGLWIEPGVNTVEVQNIHFSGWIDNGSGYGALMKGGGEFIVRNCQFTNNDCGVSATQNTTFSFTDNVFHPGNRRGVNVGYNATGAINNNTFVGGTGDHNAIDVSRNVVCHVDDNTMTGYVNGVFISMASRVSADRNTISNNDVGVIATGASERTNNSNTFTDNDINYSHQGAARELRMHSQGPAKGTEYRIAATHATGYEFDKEYNITKRTVVYSGSAAGSIPGQWFDSPGKRLRFVLQGEVLTSTSYSTRFEIGTTLPDGSGWSPFSVVNIPADVDGLFTVEVEVHAWDAATQRAFAKATMGGTYAVDTQSRYGISDRTVDMSQDRVVRVYAEPTQGTGHFRLFHLEVFAIG